MRRRRWIKSSKVMASAQGKVLLHCTIAWRASHMWGAYLIRERKMPVATALTHVRGINLLEDKPFGNQQPIEGFLGCTSARTAAAEAAAVAPTRAASTR